MSRLTIDLTEKQHSSLKALAALKNQTIKQYTLERLFPGDVDADQAWSELRALLSVRIQEGLAGDVSDLSVQEIMESELGKDVA